MLETRSRQGREGRILVHEPRSRSRWRSAIARYGMVLLLADLPLLCSHAASIQHTANAFVLTGSNSVITISDTNGSVLSVSAAGQSGSIATSGEFGLWSATFKEGGGVNAAAFNSTSASNTFRWSLAPPGDVLLLTYSNAQLSVAVNVSNRDNGVDLSAQVQPRQNTVLEFDLPGRMRFVPANLQRLICPLHSSDGVGAAFNSRFFQAQPEFDPAGWSATLAGSAGYVSLYGGSLVFRPVDDPPVPVTFTSDGFTWLGTNVAAAWNGSNGIVNRPPASGQADLILVDSSNGAYFSASHLGGAGFLFRLGGEVATAQVPMAQDLVVAAIEHLAQQPLKGRTNVALLDLERGPSAGGWAAVPVSTWRSRLRSSSALAKASVQVVSLVNAQAMLDALASTNYLAILNPYGEWTPALLSSGISYTVTAIGRYVRGGGNWFETGGYPFYYALLPTQYYSCNVPYPPAFADFYQLETASGNASLFGVQPDTGTPWAGSNNPTALFVPGRLAWGGDTSGGYCERAFGTFVAPGQTWQSPVVRLAVGYNAADALSAYCQANSFNRGLAAKMSPAVLDKFKRSVLVYYSGTCADKIAHLTQLPSPALVHFADYLMGGFDKEYPDHLPPNPGFGTPADFTNFVARSHDLGLLIMPYTNPTWWCDHPRGPTFLSAGTAPLLVNLDGSLSYEIYGNNDGYTVSHWHPAVQAANRLTRSQFTTSYPADLLFEDQCGARTWQYDLNSASPTPYAYAAGIASRVAEDSQTLPLSTENGWDRIVNYESQFCGMTWATVTTANPPSWQTFLRDRFSTQTWDIFPLVQYVAHDKVSLVLHDLGQFVTSDEVLAWNLGLGFGLSYSVSATSLDQAATRQWLLWLDRVQKSVCARYTGQPVTSFSHAWGTNAASPDNGIIQAAYGQVNVLANLGPQPLTNNNVTLAPFGFRAAAPGMLAGNVMPSAISNASSSPICYVVETNSTKTDFWIYGTGEQNAAITLPTGLDGATTVQLDNHSPTRVQVQNSILAVSLGMKPDQDRIQPPSALAGKAPRDWPGNRPAIGILNLPGLSSAWTTITVSDWLQAFNQSSLVTQFGVPIRQITTYAGLTTALQAGPTNWFAIVNPYGERFPESAAGQWQTTLGLIHNYVNNGGCWWETAGYTFYVGCWLQSGAWQTETIGPSGIGSLGLPVGGGANNQPAEPLAVTASGQAFFGPALSAQLQGLTATVNRGLLRDGTDPGHVALLAGAQQDFLGAYRLDGWGYLWRVGGFLPNPNVVLPAAPAVMTYLFTNPPLPAVANPVKYLWHGTLTLASRPILQATLATSGGVALQLGNCPPGATNYLERSFGLDNPSGWQPVFTFSSPPVETNWIDPITPSVPQAFYRVRSMLGP